MKPIAETLPPPATTPELLPHEWADNGDCTNPETVSVDFGAKGGQRACSILLGLCPDGSWRAGYAVTTKSGEQFAEPCADHSFASTFVNRGAALRLTLKNAEQHFAGDAPALRGLSALFAKSFGAQETAAAPEGGLPPNVATASSAPLPSPEPRDLPVALISPNPEQPRREHDAVAEQELADSIASTGLAQRIGVRQLLPAELGELPGVGDHPRYEVLFGERRWRAFRRLERETIPCEVYTGLTRAQGKAIAIVENLQREELNPIDEAAGFRDLMNAEGLNVVQCAARVGKSRPLVSNALRVLELVDQVPALGDYIRRGELTTAHGVALARFKAWPAAVAIMAEEAAKTKLPSSALEKDVPCLAALVKAGAVAQCHYHEVDNEWPSQIKKHPAYVRLNEWCYVCFEPDHWKGIVELHEQDRATAAAAEEAKRQKAAEKAAKNPAKIKSLADLPRDSFRIVEDQSALALMPDSTTKEVPRAEGAENVTVCTAPDLAAIVEDLIADAKREDRKPKWQGVMRQALGALTKVKKLSSRELLLLFYLAGTARDSDGPTFTEDSGKDLGVKLPKKIFNRDYVGVIDFTPASLAALHDAGEPVVIWRVLMDRWLRLLENNLVDEDYDFSPDGDLGTLCKWLLGVDELGFLEETKAGLKQIQKLVEANGEYQAALAAATGAVESKSSAKGKK